MPRRSFHLLTSAIILAGLWQGCAWLPHRPVSPLAGTWVNRVGAVWTIKQDGTFEVDLTNDGKPEAWGKYSIDGQAISLQSTGGMMPKDCTSDGLYRFERKGSDLTFTLVRDSCRLRRRNVLLGWRLKR